MIRQVNQLWKDQSTKPDILLSSSCANSELLKQGADDIKEAFLTHPMLASDFNKEGGWAIRGTQAFELLKQLIKGQMTTSKNYLGKMAVLVTIGA